MGLVYERTGDVRMMGDAADMALESSEGGHWGDYVGPRSKRPGGVRCRYCGKSGFAWTSTDRGFRLMVPQTGDLHTCESHPSRKPKGTRSEKTTRWEEALQVSLDGVEMTEDTDCVHFDYDGQRWTIPNSFLDYVESQKTHERTDQAGP